MRELSIRGGEYPAGGGLPWLWPAVSLDASADVPAEVAMDAVDLAARLVDGVQWLQTADFESIMYGINLRMSPGLKPSVRVRDGRLEYRTQVDLTTIPARDSDMAWWFFNETLKTLSAIAERYELPSPPFRLEALKGVDGFDEDPASAGPALPPASHYAPSDVEADLAALEEDEVLLVVRYQKDGESESAATARRQRQESTLVRLLGPVRASSASGNAYILTFSTSGQ